MDRTDRRLILLIRLALLPGFLAATYLAYSKVFDKAIYCATGGCKIIESSQWSELLGIPVTVIGMGAYITIFGSTFIAGDRGKLLGAFVAVTGAAFSLWLQYQALFVLEHLCPYCLTSAICMQVLAGLTITRLVRLPTIDPLADAPGDALA